MSTLSLPLSFPLRWHVPRPMLVALAALVVAALIVGTVIVRSQSTVKVTTAPVVRQTLTQSITASGTINAQNSVSVGTQVSGTISQLNVDFNSKVKKGQVLARIDPSTIQAQLDQASANLAQSEAQAAAAAANANGAGAGVSVAQANAAAESAAANAAKANISKAQAMLTLAQQQLNRDSSLLAQGYIPQATVQADQSNVAQDAAAVSQAQAAYAQAQAQASAGSATIGQTGSTAQAQAASAQAAQAAIGSAAAIVQQDTVNLHNTVITSPVDGTVVSRAVSLGQTVAASLQTPTLFTIAQDLAKMEVDINVGEPDIGGVKQGDSVDFTVLAYPAQIFHGTVRQVRINPQTLNNVVTYDVVVDVNNPGGKLLPGMTANATVNVASANNALVVPLSALHAALRQAQGDTGSTSGASTGASPWGGSGGASGSVAAGQNATVMVQRNGKLQRVQVQVGLVTSTQAAVTPINGSTLSEGDNVVTAFSGTRKSGGAAGARSPLAGGPGRGAHGIP
ncbi:MAG TPA: efflux RND transporter periplasmic adaptor subunit [Candidatus Baltobacteraceae bacterium]|nr:efflux RND transporter periplasmic adaptor subunit [Candidatus Baltobacteraceae bacterium]